MDQSPLDTNATWIADNHALDAEVAVWPDALLVGADTEFMRRDTFFPKLALLQIAAEGNTSLIDPLACAPNDGFRQHLEHPDSVCIMHSAGEDMEALAAWLPHGPAQLFDTQIAAAMVGMGAGLSYQKLVLAVTGVDLPKGETRSDWLRRPLSASQCEYAAQDVLHLHVIHDYLHTRLLQRDRLAWLREDSARLCHRAEHEQIDAQPQRAVRGASDWSPERQALLRRVLLWRERCARELDKPRPWLLDDKLALTLVADPPSSLEALFECVRGRRAMRGPQRQALFELLQRPLDADEIDATAAIPAVPARSDRHALDALKSAVDTLATELDLPPGLLCPRRLIEELLMTRAWPQGLEGWRHAILAPKLLPLLPD